MKNDIASNIRQGTLAHRTRTALLMNQNYEEENDGENDDENDGDKEDDDDDDKDDDDEENELNDGFDGIQSRLRTCETGDESSEEEEE